VDGVSIGSTSNTLLATTAAITGVADNVGIIQGAVGAAGFTDDLTPTISGTITEALAAGQTLRIFNGATLLGSATVDNTAKTWTFAPTLPATAGTSYSITARVADAAGNLGVASAARTFTLDTTAPSVVSFSPLDGSAGSTPPPTSASASQKPFSAVAAPSSCGLVRPPG
jgi:hypothetical protein